MSTSPNEQQRIDATFFALACQAFATSFIADADGLFGDGDGTRAREERGLVPAYVPRARRPR